MPAVCEYTVVTKLNEYAISAAGVGEAMQRSAAALASANNSFEESIGLIVAANTTAQNPEKVGTTLKTVSMFLRAAKTEAEEAGESTEGMASSVSKLRDEIMALTGGAVDIMKDNDTLKSTFQIFDELAGVWDQLTDITQANILEKIGGKRNANITAAIINNWDLAKDAMQSAMDSEGTAVRENAKYLDSIEGRVSKFKVTFEELSQSIFNSDMLKGIVTFGDTILKIFSKVFSFLGGGKIAALLGTFGMLLNTKALGNSLSGFAKRFNNFKEIFTNGGKGFRPESAGGIGLGVSYLTTKIGEMKKAMSGLSGSFFSRISSAAQTAFGKYGAIALGINATIAAIAGIGIAVSAVKGAIDKHKQNLIDNSNAIIDKNKESEESYNGNIQALSEIKDRYEQLSQGVDTKTNKNISLSADEYKEYLDIVNQIRDISPDLVSGYDSQGNAIIKYRNAVTEAIKSQKELYDLQKQEYLSNDSGEDLFKGQKESYKDAVKELRKDGGGLRDTISDIVFDANGMYKDGAMQSLLKALQDIGVEVDGNAVSAENMWDAFDDANALQKIYDKKDILISALGGLTDEKGISNIKDAIVNMSDAIMDIQDIKATEGDWLLEKMSDESWYKSLPTEALADFKNKIIELDDPSKSMSENLATAKDFGKEVAEVFGSDVVKGMDDLADKMKSGEISVSDYMDSVMKMEDGLKSAGFSEAVQTFVRQYYESLTSGMTSVQDKVAKTFDDLESGKKIDLSQILGGQGGAAAFTKQINKYLDDVNLLKNALSDLESGKRNTDSIKEARDRFKDLDMSVEGVQNKIGELNSGMRADFAEKISSQSGEARSALIELENEVLKLGSIVGEMKVDIDIEAESTGLEKVKTAMTEATSSTGLSTDTMSGLRERYADVISYLNNVAGGGNININDLFQRTANGISLNSSMLATLEKRYNDLKIQSINSDLSAMSLEYDAISNELSKCTDKNSAYAKSLKNQLTSIEDSMVQGELLANQYEGLTSSFHQWEIAQETANHGAMYDQLAGGVEGIKELYENGKVGVDDFRAAVQLMTDENLSEANFNTHQEYIDKLKQVYEDGIGSLQKYFTPEDERVGLANFLGDLSEATDYVKELSNGDYEVHLNVDDASKLAKELGISSQEAEILMRKLSEYGYDVNFDSIYASLDQVKSMAESKIQDLKDKGIIDLDMKFNFRSTDVSELDTQINYLKEKKQELYDDDGKLKVGVDKSSVDQINTMLAALIRQKAAATTPALLSITTTGDGEAANAIALLQQLAGYVATAQVEIETTGSTTEETQNKINETTNALNELPDSVFTTLGINKGGDLDPSDIDGLSEKLAAIDKDVEVNVKAKIGEIEGLDTVGGEKTMPVTAELDSSEPDNYKPEDKTMEVGVNFNHSAVDRWTPPPKHGIVTYTAVGLGRAAGTFAPTIYRYTRKASQAGQISTSGRRSVRGLTKASGSAFRSGSWGTKGGGVALMGELGPELVVF